MHAFIYEDILMFWAAHHWRALLARETSLFVTGPRDIWVVDAGNQAERCISCPF